MCGRYTTEIETDERELFQMLARAEQNIFVRADNRSLERVISTPTIREVFPSEPAAVLTLSDSHNIDAYLFRWGFPSAFHGKHQLLINARAEGVSEKAIFAPHFLYRRCVIPTAGFFEWEHHGMRANPAGKYRFNLPDTGILFLAGFYRCSETVPGENEFIILTREANDSMAPIHNRMPVIIRR